MVLLPPGRDHQDMLTFDIHMTVVKLSPYISIKTNGITIESETKFFILTLLTDLVILYAFLFRI